MYVCKENVRINNFLLINMDQLDQVVLFQIATMLDLDNLLSLCQSDRRFNRLICQQNAIWLYKLNNEYPDWKQHFDNKNVRKVYSLLVKLSKLNNVLDHGLTIYQLFKLTKLLLWGKNIKVIPPEIGLLTNLDYLSIRNNKIITLPPEIGLLTKLDYLSLDDNKIITLPPEIGLLTNLQYLSISKNQLTTLPSEIGSLKKLVRLYLNGNKITALPPEIGSLSNLEHLWLHNNQIVTLPLEIGSLTKLKELQLYNNHIVTLPPEISLLTNLKEISIDKKVTNVSNNLKKISNLF